MLSYPASQAHWTSSSPAFLLQPTVHRRPPFLYVRGIKYLAPGTFCFALI